MDNRNKINKRLVCRGLLLTLFALGLAGCNTVRGVGTDIQEASDNTAEAIDDVFDGDKDN
ncbi:MAG: hypothetical protein K8E66_04015 [Phycisphaerales bacterium]|nr:hypothetical protein [Phycisphaerales bacterium]